MSSTTLRPNGTKTAASTIVGGTGTTHGVTSDDSDASYARNTGTIWVDIGTVALPAGAVTSQIRCRWRGRTESGTATYAAQSAMTIRHGPSFGDVVGAVSLVGASTTLQTVTGAYLPATLTQAEVSALVVDVLAASAKNTYVDLRSYELYVDLVYVEQPVVAVTAVSPDPYTASSQLSIAWTNTLDADGGGQTRCHLKVFSDAQYSAGGFDPDTSVATYDSGERARTAEFINTPGLVDDTYRAYVRVAQSVNGVHHWSDWAYDEFELAVATVDVSSVAAVADNTNAKITVTVTRDAADGAWEYVEVERSTDGKVTWVPVRGATFVDATGDADEFVIDDYEVGNGVDADYRARATYYTGGLPITSAWTETASATQWTSTATWFKVPGSPTLNDTFNFKVYPTASRPTRRGVFYVLGTARPVVVSDVRVSPNAQCSVQTSTEAEAESLLDILAEPVVLIQTPTTVKRWGSRYCSTGDLSDEPIDPHTHGNSGYAIWRFDAVEVDIPADPDAGSA